MKLKWIKPVTCGFATCSDLAFQVANAGSGHVLAGQTTASQFKIELVFTALDHESEWAAMTRVAELSIPRKGPESNY